MSGQTLTAAAPVWLMDVGSTVIKLLRTGPSGVTGPPVRETRQRGVAPGDQAARLLARSGFAPSAGALRACSSAGSGPTVGVVGLTGRYSIAAAVRATVTAGADVSYTRTLHTPVEAPLPLVDVLVMVGGVDGTDHGRLERAVRAMRLSEHPHRILVWAGAHDAAAAAALRPHHRAGNVIDGQLRADCGPLAQTLRHIHLADIVDRQGLRALSELLGAPVPATPDAVGDATRELAAERGGTAPVLVVDVGGSTTDVHRCAAAGPSAPGPGWGESQVFSGLGVAGARRSLLARLTDTPVLDEFVGAVAPADRRTRYLRLREGDSTALPPQDAALACLFLALRQLPEEHRASLPCDTRLLVTGGAVAGLAPGRLSAVAEAACGAGPFTHPPAVDTTPGLWARGLLARRPAPA
ncbi:glutamate mutase L [Streptomyces sp. NPDC058371]|uniref:glutamate mutase L n=1 Tax=Streptomyces sp. NPDC058371 TaxID=3346463 RepID=UPI003660AA68